MGVNRIIQVAGSNTLHKAKDVEDLKSELRTHVVKVNDALRRLSQLLYTSEGSGGVSNITVLSPGSGDTTTITTTNILSDGFRKSFLFMGS